MLYSGTQTSKSQRQNLDNLTENEIPKHNHLYFESDRE
jgi:hypothetical protein